MHAHIRKTLLTSVALIGLAAASSAMAQEEIKIGVILGFTGPTESLTPDMAA